MKVKFDPTVLFEDMAKVVLPKNVTMEHGHISERALHVRFLLKGRVFAHWYPSRERLYLGSTYDRKLEQSFATLQSVVDYFHQAQARAAVSMLSYAELVKLAEEALLQEFPDIDEVCRLDSEMDEYLKLPYT